MRFHSAITDEENADDAVARIVEAANGAMEGEIDVAFVFFTGHFRADADRIIEELWLELDPQSAKSVARPKG